MPDSIALAIACFPLGFYLLALGGINLRRRPTVMSGTADVLTLALAVSGMVVVGPLNLFLPEAAANRFGVSVWALLVTFYVLCVVLCVLVARPRLVIFNLTRDRLWPVLEQVVRRLDGDVRVAADAVQLPQLTVQFHLEAASTTRNLSLVATGDLQSYSHWKRLQRELASALRGIEVMANPRGFTLITFGLFLIGWPLVHLLRMPSNAVAQVYAVREARDHYGPIADVSQSKGAIVLAPTDPNVLKLIGDAPPGASFYFKTGVYADLQIEPKAGQKFVGGKGAVLKSERRLYAFDCFDRPVEEVTIENLVIDGYTPPVQCGSISGGKRWHVKNCEVRNSATGGIQLMDGSTVDQCYIHHCGQIGIKLFGQSPSLRNSEVAFNNPNHKYDVYDEAGGSKFWQTKKVLIQDNYFHDNVGCGIWLDCDNSGGIVRGNRCENNTLAGIYQEIGGELLIEGNTCSNDGTEYDKPNWLHGAGIVIEASQNVTVRKNTISGCANGVGIIATSRGEERWTIKNIVVAENAISMSKGRTGVVWDGKAPPPWEEVRFSKNDYTLASAKMFAWKDGTISDQQWKAAGQDAGSMFAIKQ